MIEDKPSERRDMKLRNQLNSSSNNRSYQNKSYTSGDITNTTHVYNKLREEPRIFVWDNYFNLEESKFFYISKINNGTSRFYF